MADAYLTTANVAAFNKVDMDLVVSDVLNDSPALRAMAARSVPGYQFFYTKETAAPSVGFRDVNDGRENAKATRSRVQVDLKVMDASFSVDVAAAQAADRGEDFLMMQEAMSHLRAAMFGVEQQIFGGTVEGAAAGFSGFADQTNLDDSDDAMVVDATGSSAGTGSSVYLVRLGEGDVQVLWGQNGMIEIGERTIQQEDGSATGQFPAYYHPITAWCGVKIGSAYSVARIANLTEDSGKGLTDALIYQALSLFPASRQPNVIVMNRRSLRQLRDSRTATNAVGAPAPRPTDVEGIPIITTDAITNTETLLTAA